MKYQKRDKTGQMNLSFGTIFSIILIISFIAFAAVGISKFIHTQQFAQVEEFKSDLQGEIDSMWQSSSGSQKIFEHSLPKKISEVCFINDNYENMYFVPNDFRGKKLLHVNIQKTIPMGSNKLCVNNIDGEIKMTLKIEFGEDSVTIIK